ncbi:hypothetical protein ACJX0J_012309, partial [Zea mays]
NHLASGGQGCSQPEKGSLDESPSDDGLPNKQMNKPKKSVRVNFLPRKKARKPMEKGPNRIRGALPLPLPHKPIYHDEELEKEAGSTGD